MANDLQSEKWNFNSAQFPEPWKSEKMTFMDFVFSFLPRLRTADMWATLARAYSMQQMQCLWGPNDDTYDTADYFM